MSLRFDPRALPAELASLGRLALPIVSVQVGLMFMLVVDTLLVGRVSPVALAAVALGNLYSFTILVFGMGVLFALDPLVSQGLGAGDREQVTLAVQRSLMIAVALTVVSSLLCLPVAAVLRLLGQPAEVVPLAQRFVHTSIPSLLPFFVFLVFRQTLQGMKRLRPVVVTIVAANVLNAVLASVLVLGLFGFPRFGVVGAAWATNAARWFMTITLGALGWRELRPYLLPFRREALNRAALARVLGLGLPIGTQMLLESGVFAVVGLMMGRFGTVPVAAHQVTINLVSLTFMVPLGVSSAASVLVGRAVGGRDMEAARRASAAALVAGVGFMLLTSATFALASRPLAAVYTPDAEVRDLAAALIVIGGVFQIFDGTQVVSIGALRGLGDTQSPMWINILGFWLVGFPVSLLLGYRLGFGPRGLWWGFVVGLAVVAVMLLARLRHRLRVDVARLEVDAASPTV